MNDEFWANFIVTFLVLCACLSVGSCTVSQFIDVLEKL